MTIVVPCYNEAERLLPSEFVRFGRRVAGVRFLFIDDGSTDDTRPVLERLCAACPERFDWLSMPENLGQGEAVRRGVRAALARRDDYVGYWDADLAAPLDEIVRFVAVLDRENERLAVFGSRRVRSNNGVRRQLWRRVLGRTFAVAAASALGLRIYDTQCGAKLFRRSKEVEAMFAAPFSSRWIFDVELLARLIRETGCRSAAQLVLAELPLDAWRDIPGSKLRFADFVRAVPQLARIALGLRRITPDRVATVNRGRIASDSFSS